MRNRDAWIFVCVVTFSLILLTLPVKARCGQDINKDMPDEFKIPYCCALSGPYAAFTYPNYLGAADFCKWYNEEKGGLFGKVPVKLVTRDFGTKLYKALEAYEEFRGMEPKPPLVLMAFGNAQEALAERYKEDQIVGLGSPTPTAIYHIFPGTWTFGWSPSYADSCGFLIKWLAEHWTPKTGQKTKLAFLTWDNAMGRAPMIDPVREYAKKMGVEIVAEEVYSMKSMDVTAQLSKIKSAGANWIYSNALGPGPVVIAKCAESLGINNHELYDTTPGKIHLAGGPWSGNRTQSRLAPKAMVGWISTPPIAAWDDETPVMEIIRQVFEKNDRKPEYRGMAFSATWGFMGWVMHVIEETVKDVGWKNLNGKNFRKHLVQLRDYALLGDNKFVVASVSEERPGPDRVTLWRLGEDGKPYSFVPFSKTPDLHPSPGSK